MEPLRRSTGRHTVSEIMSEERAESVTKKDDETTKNGSIQRSVSVNLGKTSHCLVGMEERKFVRN